LFTMAQSWTILLCAAAFMGLAAANEEMLADDPAVKVDKSASGYYNASCSFTAECQSNLQCLHFKDDVMLDRACLCDETKGEEWHTQKELCFTGYGKGCIQPKMCTAKLNMRCKQQKCSCKENHVWDDDKKICILGSFVEEVTQNYKANINTLINVQIRKELQASYLYQAYASYFQRADVALPGIQKFFAAASLEEREHAQMLIDYVNTRGGHVQLDNIELNTVCNAVNKFSKQDTDVDQHKNMLCVCQFVSQKDVAVTCESDHATWSSGLIAFQDALVTERYVNNELLELHRQADLAEDAHLSHILEHHFLDEQVTSINQLMHYVTRLSSFKGDNYRLGEYLFDSNLK